ncbi:MAG: hypothetical protein E6K70_11460 [Planctomycetota bacterium]|nr:MAG: hypothetical protein E6K70_11460 [Planctomycetota bacterium]
MPTAPQGLVALVTDAIAYVASLQAGQSGPITVAIADEEGHAVTVVIGASGLVSATEQRAVAGLLNDVDHAILETVRNSQEPLRGKQIAAQLGKRYSSHFREALARLCQQHVLLRTTTGYIPADPSS